MLSPTPIWVPPPDFCFMHSYILRRFTTVALVTNPHWLPNTEMTKPCEVSDETVLGIL